MRVLMVAQRYGAEVPGGAEVLARQLATRLAARGHEVSVLSSCAIDYTTWADEYPPGITMHDGVRVRREPVVRPRHVERFNRLSPRLVAAGEQRSAPLLERSWMWEQGPVLQNLPGVLAQEADGVDVVAFMTYLYPTTVFGVPVVAGRRPTVLHPTLHDEWCARFPSMRRAFDVVDGLAFSTPEELDYCSRRFRPTAEQAVLGIGFEDPPANVDVAAFRQRFGLGDRPYLACVGRVDTNKGVDRLVAAYRAYRRIRPDAPDLVLCGANVMNLVEGDGVHVTGFVSEEERWAALAGSVLVVQPSMQESFGMTITEAWLTGRPVLVHARSEVTAGLVNRGRGGLTYDSFTSFAAAVDLLCERPELAAALGSSGRALVDTDYRWPVVLDRYEELLDRSMSRFNRRLGGRRSPRSPLGRSAGG